MTTSPADTYTPDRRQLLFYSAVLMAFLGASGVPTPLYQLYQQSWQFSTPMLTLVFATYLFALLLTLLFTGALSDHLGRRPVILAGLLLQIISMLCFALATDLGWLFAARALQGLATGIVTSALGAALIDSDRQRGPLMASVAPMLGMGLGVLGAGVLVEMAPWPMRLVYIVIIALFVWQALGLRRTTERIARRPGALASMKPRVRVPSAVMPTFIRAMPASIAAWALGGFTLSLGPALTEWVSGSPSALLGALPASLLTVMGSLGVWRLRHLPTATILLLSGTLLPAGLAIVLGGVFLHSSALLLGGYALAGLGFGPGFMGAMRAIMAISPVDARASLMAAFYVASYLAASLPALVAGVSTRAVGVEATVYGYASLVMLLALTVPVSVLRRRPGVL